MSIITKIINGKKYLYDVIFEDGKHKWKVIGHLDEAGNFIPSKKMRGKKPEDFPAEIQRITTTTTKIRVVNNKEEKRNFEELPAETKELSMTATSENVENESRTTEAEVPEEVKALAVPEKGTQNEKTETVEVEIVSDDKNLPQVVSNKPSQYKSLSSQFY